MSLAKKVKRSESVLIQTQNEIDCEASKTTTFRWKIYKISRDPVSYDALADPVLVKEDDQSYYRLAATSLDFGFYKLHFTVIMEGVIGISGSAVGYIQVVATQDSLQAAMNGGPLKRYKFGTVVSLIITTNLRAVYLSQNRYSGLAECLDA